MRFVPLAVAAGMACFLLGSGAASAACKSTPDSLFVDKFEQLDEAWGSYENYDVEGGKLVIKPPAGYNTTAINNTSLYDDVDICVEMSAEAPVQEGSCGSIVFWAIDYDNYYSFQVSTEGQASFWRRQRDKWLNQVSWQDAPGAAKGANVINELRVITNGRTAKLYVNGQLFRQVKGQPPKDGSLVGLMACAPNDATAHIAFSNLVVNTPKPETEPVAEKPSEASGGNNNAGGAATDNAGKGASPGAANGGGAAPAAAGSGDNNGAGGAAAAGGGNGGSSGGAPGGSDAGGSGGAAAPGAGATGAGDTGGAAGSSGGSAGGSAGSNGSGTGN